MSIKTQILMGPELVCKIKLLRTRRLTIPAEKIRAAHAFMHEAH